MHIPFFRKNSKTEKNDLKAQSLANAQKALGFKRNSSTHKENDRNNKVTKDEDGVDLHKYTTIKKDHIIFGKQSTNLQKKSHRSSNKLQNVLDRESSKVDNNFIKKYQKSSTGKGASNREKIVKRKNLLRKSITILIIILSPFLLAAFIYFAIQTVLQIRDNDNTDNLITGQVYGFADIPVYPGSSFIFENYEDSTEVKEFISAGYSIYRLSPGTVWTDVEFFYNEQLQQLGWEQVKDVPRSDNSMKYGKYFVKEGIGLRIYTEIDDIVFQRVSETDAREGLKRVVDAENTRKQAIKQNSTVSLLPDYPWRLEMPGSYVVTYTSSNVSTIQKAKITMIGDTENFVEIIPFITYDGRLYDEHLFDYTSQNNISIVNSQTYLFSDLIGLKAQLKSEDDKNMVAYVINSPRDNVVFIFYGPADANSIMDFLVENIVPMNINR